MKGETAGQLSKLHPGVRHRLHPAPRNLHSQILTRENETGKIGTFETKFVIPDLTTQLKYVPISSVALEQSKRQGYEHRPGHGHREGQEADRRQPVGAGQSEAGAQCDTRVQRRTRTCSSLLQAYQPDAQTTQPLVASVSFYRGKVKAFETAPLQITDGLDAKTKALPIRFSVPLTKLLAGRYTCQVPACSIRKPRSSPSEARAPSSCSSNLRPWRPHSCVPRRHCCRRRSFHASYTGSKATPTNQQNQSRSNQQPSCRLRRKRIQQTRTPHRVRSSGGRSSWDGLVYPKTGIGQGSPPIPAPAW